MIDTPSRDAAFNALRAVHPDWTLLELTTVLGGKATEAEILDRRDLNAAEEVLRKTKRAAWPSPDIVWDLEPLNFHRSMDGMSAAEFATEFGDLETLWVEVDDLEAAFAPAAKRTGGPFDRPYLTKTRRLIAHLQRGGEVSPPLLHVQSGLAGLALAGGYHRTHWARHTGAGAIPVLVRKVHLDVVLSKITPTENVRPTGGLRGVDQGYRSD
jgi:hypothetical protein